MTARELSQVIGRTGTVEYRQHPGCRYAVRVLDAKMSYGKPVYQIQPVQGSGTAWCDAARVDLEDLQS